MITIRPFKYRPVISPIQRQKPFPENCVCDVYIFYYKCFERCVTVLIPSKRINSLCHDRPISELIDAGVFDMTGEFVEIPLGKYVKVNDKPCDRITQFCMMTKDDDGNEIYIDGYSPSEIKARFVNQYPECEP